MIRLLLMGCLLLLSACASQPPLPEKNPALALPLQLHVQRLADGQSQDWLLVIQREDGAIRWSMMDPLGIPQARQKLIDGAWQADGLLPPNPQARELFAALLFALTPAEQVPAHYPSADWQQHGKQRWLRDGDETRWQLIYQQPENFQLKTQAADYRVEMLP